MVDDEAQIYYALALNVGASPSDTTYANQLKGAAILETIWARQPDHPGIAHYLIHLYDTPDFQIFLFYWGWRRPNLRLLSFQGSEFN